MEVRRGEIAGYRPVYLSSREDEMKDTVLGMHTWIK